MLLLENVLAEFNKTENIICIGIGKLFEQFQKIFDETGLVDRIVCCVDNNMERQGQRVYIGKRELLIKPITVLNQYNPNNTAILITCVKYQGIVQQLEQNVQYKKFYYFCAIYFKALWEEKQALGKKIPSQLKLSREQLIPKKIHYCWFGRNPIPEKNRKWMESWKKYCPDYEIIEWNEYNYDISKWEYMRQAYERKKWGFVPDIARLDIIYQHGGVYLDTDVELVQNLDDLLYQDGFVGFETSSQINLGLGFGASRGMPVFQEMLNDYRDKKFINPDGSLNMIVSPKYQTALLEKKGLLLNGEYQKMDGLTILPEKVLCGKSYLTKRVRLTEYTRAIHHFDGSWRDEDVKRESLAKEESLLSVLGR